MSVCDLTRLPAGFEVQFFFILRWTLERLTETHLSPLVEFVSALTDVSVGTHFIREFQPGVLMERKFSTNQ